MSVNPYIIRSQRNQERRPAALLSTSNQASEIREDLNHGNESKLRLVKKNHHLGYLSTSTIILNRMVGTSIFVAPPVVLAIVGSKGLDLILWVVGGVIAWAGMMIYLEYGYRFPLTGGELHYIDCVWTRPKSLLTYVYSIMFIFFSGSGSNSLIFGASVIRASTPAGTPIDPRLQKFFAILLVAATCVLQALSRMNYIRFCNLFGLYKISFLTALTVLGWCALASKRTSKAAASGDPYGTINFQDSFKNIRSRPYEIALALLAIMRAYSGYEYANFVLEEVRRPPRDETRVFRLSALITVSAVCFYYVMINVALFAACPTDELLAAPDVLSLFFTKIFGHSDRIHVASGILLSLSSAGNVMTTTFAAVRVKQEIARLGIIPVPEFWAKSTRLDTPGPALLLHWIFSTIAIIAVPLDTANGYLIFSTLYNYARTLIGTILGTAILFASRLDSFKVDGTRWGDSKTKLALYIVYAQAIIYIMANVFVFVVSWFPASLQDTLHTKKRVLPTYIGPLATICVFGAGALLWVWDLYITPALGYRVEVMQERTEGLNVHMTFCRHVTGVAAKASKTLQPLMKLRRELSKKGLRDSDDEFEDNATNRN